MAKTITFTYDGIDYTLQYTRRTIKRMEANGFVADDIDKKPATLMPQLFEGAFLAHHAHTKPAVINDIFTHFPNKEMLFEKLVEMYNEPLYTLLEEPEEEGKVDWTANW